MNEDRINNEREKQLSDELSQEYEKFKKFVESPFMEIFMDYVHGKIVECDLIMKIPIGRNMSMDQIMIQYITINVRSEVLNGLHKGDMFRGAIESRLAFLRNRKQTGRQLADVALAPVQESLGGSDDPGRPVSKMFRAFSFPFRSK